MNDDVIYRYTSSPTDRFSEATIVAWAERAIDTEFSDRLRALETRLLAVDCDPDEIDALVGAARSRYAAERKRALARVRVIARAEFNQ